MKTCPYCAEQVQDEALKCRYCHEFLNVELQDEERVVLRALADCGEPVTPTDLSRNARMTTQRVCAYFKLLSEKGLVEQRLGSDGRNRFLPTALGARAVGAAGTVPIPQTSEGAPSQQPLPTDPQKAISDAILSDAATAAWGTLNAALVCPHCHRHGAVRTKAVEIKAGISGAKATGAVLTGGLSVLGTGLSRKEKKTQAHCGNCESTWDF